VRPGRPPRAYPRAPHHRKVHPCAHPSHARRARRACRDPRRVRTPADGDRIESPPDEVVLTFSADPIEVGSEVLVVDADGTDWSASEPEYSGRDVTVGLDPDMPDGDFEIQWRVVSSDGHPIQGVIEFEVASGSGADSTPSDDEGSAPSAGTDSSTQQPTDEATDQSEAPSAGGSTDPSDEPGDADEPDDADQADPADQSGIDQADDDSSVPWVPIAVVAGAVILAALVVAAVLRARRSRREDSSADSSTTP
jgi:methionine-rich copper-binding protein CopC